MIILFDNTVTEKQANDPKWVWENWLEGIPCLSYVEAEKLNNFYFRGKGFIRIMVGYENAKLRGWT